MTKNKTILSEKALAEIKREIAMQEEKLTTVSREGRMWKELECLEIEIANLESAIKELGTRLSPISHPIVVEQPDENVGHDLSEIPGCIRVFTTKTSDLVEHVTHMIEGLDI